MNRLNNNFLTFPEDTAITPKKMRRQVLRPQADSQADLLKDLINKSQNGCQNSLAKLCEMFEPLFKKEMRRDIFIMRWAMKKGSALRV